MKLKQWSAQQHEERLKEALTPPKDISVTRLIDDGLVILYREIKALDLLSSEGKLGPNEARDLRDHLKLLFELKERESDSLKNISDEELSKRAKAVLNE